MHLDAPNAQSATMIAQQPGGAIVATVGGFTKLEEAALRIACAPLLAVAAGNDVSLQLRDSPMSIAECVDRAQELLAECARRQKPEEANAGNDQKA